MDFPGGAGGGALTAEEGLTNKPVPIENDYTISGDNDSGFVVTVAL